MQIAETPQNKENFLKLIDNSNISYDNNLSDFKNEILAAMREMEEKIYSKYEKLKDGLNEKLIGYDSKLEQNDVKINELHSSFLNDKTKIEKINDLVIFSKKANDQLVSHEVKVNNLQKELSNACFKYDRMYMDNLVVPGTIGEYCKFKNMKEYIENNISQVGTLMTFKEKHTLDLKSYKDKLDQMLKQMSMQLDNVEKNMRVYTSKLMENTEESYKKEIADVCNRISDMRMENHKYAFNLQKTASELSVEYEKILNIKAEVYKQLDNSVQQMKDANQVTVNNFDTVKSDFERIRKRFSEIAEFIKDVRFRKNLGVDVTRQELKKMANRITFDRKRSLQDRTKGVESNLNQSEAGEDSEIESYVKRYIHGGGVSSSLKKDKIDDKDDSASDFNNNEEIEENNQKDKNVIVELTEENICQLNEGSPNQEPGYNSVVKNIDINVNDDSNNENKTNSDCGKVHTNDNEDNLGVKSCRTIMANGSAPIQKKFKDKFPNSNNSNDPNYYSNLPNINLPEVAVGRSLGKVKTVKIISNTGSKLRDDSSNSNSNNHNLLKIFHSLDSNLADFKKEVTKKMSFTEKKLLEMEHYAKKKLEELAGQVKNYIPINFNAYVKNFDALKQINAEGSKQSSTSDNDKIIEKNVCVNIIDPFIIFKNREVGNDKNTSFTGINAFNTNNMKKQHKNNTKSSQKSSKALKTIDSKLNDFRSVSKDKKFM